MFRVPPPGVLGNPLVNEWLCAGAPQKNCTTLFRMPTLRAIGQQLSPGRTAFHHIAPTYSQLLHAAESDLDISISLPHTLNCIEVRLFLHTENSWQPTAHASTTSDHMLPTYTASCGAGRTASHDHARAGPGPFGASSIAHFSLNLQPPSWFRAASEPAS